MAPKKADIIDMLPDDVTALLSELAFNDAMEIEAKPEAQIEEPEEILVLDAEVVPDAEPVAVEEMRVVSLAPAQPSDPSELGGYPPTLPIEVALRTAPPDDIRVAYGFSMEQWIALQSMPRFQSDLTAAEKMLSEEGMSFKAKARLQSEALLQTSWQMIHDTTGDVPPNVKADLLKFTVRAAGLESNPKDQAAAFTPLQININM